MTNEVKFGKIKEFDLNPFQTVLIDELIPYVDASFRTIAKQPYRAMGRIVNGVEWKPTLLLSTNPKCSLIGHFSAEVFIKLRKLRTNLWLSLFSQAVEAVRIPLVFKKISGRS